MKNITIAHAEFSALFAIREAALELSTAMVDAEAEGADFEAVDREWQFLTAMLEQYRVVRRR